MFRGSFLLFDVRQKKKRQQRLNGEILKTISRNVLKNGRNCDKIDNIYNSSFINNFLISIMGAVFQCILFIFFKDSFFIKINFSIMIFNLLPIIPLDGSKILFEI